MNYPSIKTIQRDLNLDWPEAGEVRGLIDGSINPEKYASVQRWIDDCYHRPSDEELQLCALNEVLECHGIEAADVPSSDDITAISDLQYCNAGDYYTATVCLFRGQWRVSSVSDIVEKHPRLFKEG